jgi:hypothetical protein
MYDLKCAEMTWHRSTQIFKKPSSYLKILDTRMVPLGMLHTRPTSITPHSTNFCPYGDLLPGIFTPLRLCIIFILWLW